MNRSTRGCGCVIAVAVLLLGGGTFAFVKWGLPWWRTQPPRPTGELKVVVLDVGPWEEHDDVYVFSGARPLAEKGADSRGRTTNGAGIDLGEKVWKALGMTGNDPVLWEFV